MWEQRNAATNSLTSNKKSSGDVDFFGHLKQATNLAALKEELMMIVQENMETLMTVLSLSISIRFFVFIMHSC